ncbi:hypothetical protein ACFQ1R_12905 [Mariniflexile jejuense]|uniref:Bacterial CdiA-CT RNAse A domain-containing protein n=1 Tax=Mariniflexile jejuense TaxID=1173582 RepID=A0ABW3JLJ3_9FLAO
MKGVEYGSKINKEITLNEKTTKDEIKSLVSTMGNKIILSFYDAFHNLHPTEKPRVLGDSGAFTDVRIDNEKINVKRGNHGWMDKEWSEISKTELIDIIFKSRNFNGGKMRIESRVARKIWRKDENGKSLIYFYHKVPE